MQIEVEYIPLDNLQYIMNSDFSNMYVNEIEKLYPLQFENIYKKKIWGTNDLKLFDANAKEINFYDFATKSPGKPSVFV